MKRRYFKRTIGISQKECSQVWLSSDKFPSQNFPSDNFPNVQFPKRQLLKDYDRTKAWKEAKRCGYDRLEMLPLGKLHIFVTLENNLGKWPLGKIPYIVGLFLPLYITSRYCGGTRGGGLIWHPTLIFLPDLKIFNLKKK